MPAMTVDMPQTVFFLLLQWYTDAPTHHFEHVRRWRLRNDACQYLLISTAAWSPSRVAMVRIAMRLLVCSGVRYYVWYEAMLERLGRQQDRAMQPLQFLDDLDSQTVRLRQLVRAYRVEAEVTRRLMRLHPHLRAAAARIREDVEQLAHLQEDQSSSDDPDEEP